MSKTIWRFMLDITDRPVVQAPVGARFLSVAPGRSSQEHIEAWAVVDILPDGRPMPSEEREFRIVGTGNPFPDDCGNFIGTVPVLGGRLIFHVFEAAS